MRAAIRPDHRVAIALYVFATRIEYRSLANLMGISKSTICKITNEIASILTEVSTDQWVKLPTNRDECDELLDNFKRKYGFPCCLGAIDGTHVEFLAPHKLDDAVIHFDRKKTTVYRLNY